MCILRFIQLLANGSLGGNTSSRDETEQTDTTTAVGVIKAHPDGVTGMTIMASARNSCSKFVEGREKEEEAVGFLATCGNTEGVVKVWDYTHVEDGSTCGR